MQSGTPQAETVVNYNSTTGVAGTLEINFSASLLGSNNTNGIDPNGILSAGRYDIWPKHLRGKT